MSLMQQVVPATVRSNVLGRIVLAMAAGGGVFAFPGLPVFEQIFKVVPEFEGSARASLFLCGASVVAAVFSLYRFVFCRNKAALDLRVPPNVSTWLGFLLAMGIGWLVGTTIFT